MASARLCVWNADRSKVLKCHANNILGRINHGDESIVRGTVFPNQRTATSQSDNWQIAMTFLYLNNKRLLKLGRKFCSLGFGVFADNDTVLPDQRYRVRQVLGTLSNSRALFLFDESPLLIREQVTVIRNSSFQLDT